MSSSDKPLINRVANSALITINLENYYPDKLHFIELDIKKFLFKELILKEKEFRSALKEIDWTAYKNSTVLLYCSTDAIVPVWAYMLIAANLAPYTNSVFFGNKKEFLSEHYNKVLSEIDFNEHQGKRIVIKGCSDKDVPASAYVALTKALQPIAQSIMYGEPCSTVPIFKRPRKV